MREQSTEKRPWQQLRAILDGGARWGSRVVEWWYPPPRDLVVVVVRLVGGYVVGWVGWVVGRVGGWAVG